MTVEPIAKPKKTEAPDTLWLAFAEAQRQFGPIIKNTQGARGKYAPLDAVLEMAVPVLNAAGLALTQATFVVDGTLYIRTSLVHTRTGEAHTSEYPAGPLTLQHQQLGAGVTYARRYSLLSILGVFPENEDDDGEKAGAAGGVDPTPVPPRSRRLEINPETGRTVDMNSPHQQRKAGTWQAFEAKVRSFTDVDKLEDWYLSAKTQAAITWPEEAQAEYEAAVERLLGAGRP